MSMLLTTTSAIRFTHEGHSPGIDEIVCEGCFPIYLNGECISYHVASPDLLAELGAGFVLNEQLAETIETVSVEENKIFVEADKTAKAMWGTESASGLTNLKKPRKISSSLQITSDAVFSVFETIQSEQWQKTGGLHNSVLFSDGKKLICCPDIGRHNTVDKAVGYAELNSIDRSACYLGCTGRQPEGMVAKVANAGIPIVISRAATTDRGVIVAKETNLTLIGFARQGRFTIYSHPERIIP